MSAAYPCPLCGGIHDEARRICPTTGKRIPDPPGGTLDPTELSLLGRTLANRYKVRGILGQGGMAAVFEATDITTDNTVALKVLRQKHARNQISAKRLMREAKLAGALGHPAICQVLDTGQLADGTPYLATERLYGETLAQRLTRDKFVPLADAVAIMTQVLDALAVAHARSIVHRDITPGNVFIVEPLALPGAAPEPDPDAAPVVKILDFGFSKLLLPSGEEGTETGLTGEGIVVGTPHYMSPEQIRGDKELDGRADLFAVGAVLYRALTGERPFSGPTMSAVLHAILTKNPPPPTEIRPELPQGVNPIIETAIQRDKNKRFRSAADFQRALFALRPQSAPRAVRAAPTFDVFEESGEQGPPQDSIEVEFSSSTDPPTHALRRPPLPSVSGEPSTVPRRAAAQVAARPPTVRNAAPLREDELATVERNPGVDDLLRMEAEAEDAFADDARPTTRPASDPMIDATPSSSDLMPDPEERTQRRAPPALPKPRLPPKKT
jgi:serine/threonine-protein kinase